MSSAPNGLLVCSHRGPYSHVEVDGRVEVRRGSGGLVTALSSVMRGSRDVEWLACALSTLDREVAAGRPVEDAPLRASLLDIPEATHAPFYDRACVTGLGFVFHGLFDQAYGPMLDTRFMKAWEAYRAVNRAYADALVRTAGDRTILVEDYHLMFVADDLSARVPGPTAYFHHVPWCGPALFSVLPDALRTEILGKILRFDTIGFHSGRWARAFLACCAEFLPGVRVSGERTRGGRVVWRDRDVPVVVAPAQVDAERIVRTAAGAASQRWRDSMSVDERPVIARVDRVDLWKNVVRGFLAFERLLEAGTEATFLALLARSRTHLSEYRRYLGACVREAGRINERFPRAGGPPIRLMLADSSDHDRALAVLGLADVVLVNSTCDGLNLVAKESVVAGGGRSRLVLSETTGVHEEIGEWTYGVHPFDIDGTGEAMVAALAADSVPLGLVESVWHNSAETWLSRRLAPVAG